MKFVPLRKAMEYYGQCDKTIRKYAENGNIKAKRLHSGRWLFDIDSYEKPSKQSTICYCRVSSIKQRDDLVRQVVFMREQFHNAEIIQDIGSGLNYKRKGLNSILERLLQREKLTIVVAYKDRLARFGTELIEFLIKQNGGELLVLNQLVHSPERELTEDLLAVLTVFSCRMHGLRRYKKQVEEDPDLPKPESKVNI
jgi:predicted site-specific integrase-resolvase